ncbi:hypothetical protein C7S16_6109 [Burkholderia thailandensis]|uniref:Uncharacterized protein n=1 Tax=Burkholderia thailandensis TaxID=57975 RepID=A0AAW9CV71_BURTH|nr:hypothetical protein [Burkholderia thailandensis]
MDERHRRRPVSAARSSIARDRQYRKAVVRMMVDVRTPVHVDHRRLASSRR